jgi:hypothetical protein
MITLRIIGGGDQVPTDKHQQLSLATDLIHS